MTLSKLTDIELAVLGLETYGKEHWLDADVRMLRDCWDEFQRRGEDTMSFCRPSYSNVQAFHEFDSGEVGVDDVQFLELAGAGIAADYRKVMRKLRALGSDQGTKSPRHRMSSI